MAERVSDFKDLRIWQCSMTLAERTYQFARTLPNEERFGLAFQLRRCAVSIPSNIAEGYGRHTRGDYIRFLRVANASLKELETQVLLAQRMRVVTDAAASSVLDLVYQIARMMTVLLRKLAR